MPNLEQFVVSALLLIAGSIIGWIIGMLIRAVIMDMVNDHIRAIVREELAQPEPSGLHNNRRG